MSRKALSDLPIIGSPTQIWIEFWEESPKNWQYRVIYYKQSGVVFVTLLASGLRDYIYYVK
jgi:hypothetical protein